MSRDAIMDVNFGDKSNMHEKVVALFSVYCSAASFVVSKRRWPGVRKV
jgi:hypothetical protein